MESTSCIGVLNLIRGFWLRSITVVYVLILLGLSLGRTFGRPRTAALGSLLTIDNFWKRNLIILDWCCICKQSGESVDNLLLHCSLARELWSMVFVLFDVNWVMPCHVFNLWACWQGHLGDQRKGRWWFVGWFLIVSCGVFGGRGMLITLRIVNDLFWNLNSCFFKLCMNGLLLWVYFLSIPCWN